LFVNKSAINNKKTPKEAFLVGGGFANNLAYRTAKY
jgi:hypothetical protein